MLVLVVAVAPSRAGLSGANNGLGAGLTAAQSRCVQQGLAANHFARGAAESPGELSERCRRLAAGGS